MSITDILKNYGDFSDNIIAKASDIYEELSYKLIRDKKKTLKILFCLYNAHLYYNTPVDIRVLAYKLKIPKSIKISSVFTLCSSINTGYTFIQKRFTANEYVGFYADELSNLNTLKKDKIVKIGTEVTQKIENIKKGTLVIPEFNTKDGKKAKNKLLEAKTQNLAAGIIMYYLKRINEDKIPIEELKNKLFRSTATIMPLCSPIGIVHNYS